MELEFPWVNLPLGSTKFLLIYVDRKSLCLSADSKSIKTRYCEIKIKTKLSLWVWPSKTHMWRPFWEWMLCLRLCFALYISAQHIREAQEDFQQTPWHPGMAQADQHPETETCTSHAIHQEEQPMFTASQRRNPGPPHQPVGTEEASLMRRVKTDNSSDNDDLDEGESPQMYLLWIFHLS